MSSRAKWSILAAAIGIRLLALAALPDSFWRDRASDPDGYARFAHRLATEGAYGWKPGEPSAHRPPFYPLLLLPFAQSTPLSDFGAAGIAAMHLIAAAVLVLSTWMLARRVGVNRAGVAASIVALDPLLIRQSALIMTETVFCALFGVLLVIAAGPQTERVVRWRPALVAGMFLAAAGLTRPIAWIWWIALGFLGMAADAPNRKQRVIQWSLVLCIAIASSSLWVVRNAIQFGAPILTTTHGGYTLWLGQNPSYYAEVVAGPNAVWPMESFDAWTRANTEATRGMDEIERDSYFRSQAIGWMMENPGAAARSMAWHVASFWSPVPRLGASVVRGLCGLWYAVVFVLALAGLCDREAWRPPRLILPMSLLVFTAVHAAYWSDVRMRAPLAIVLAVLAARGLERLISWKRGVSAIPQSK